MWNPFRKKPLLSEGNEAFQIETYKWLLKNFGGKYFYEDAKLVLPTEDFFPIEEKEPEKVAHHIFELVKNYAGLEKWPCILKIQESDPELRVSTFLTLQNVEHNPLGTFSTNENNEVIITYNPKLTSDPTQMVATFSHELSHYLTSTSIEPPPGGWDNWEFATDITATFLGFGIFHANSVFNFQQVTEAGAQGWQTSGGGYLSEAEHSYALAVFLKLKNISPEFVYPHCDVNIKAYLKKALSELEDNSYIEELLKIQYVEQAQPSENST
jgi:hypothetical protein